MGWRRPARRRGFSCSVNESPRMGPAASARSPRAAPIASGAAASVGAPAEAAAAALEPELSPAPSLGTIESSSDPWETRSPTLTCSSLYLAGERGRHVHRRLVGLERQQRVVDRDGVSGRDVDLDDRDVGEVADVRDLDRDGLARRGHTCTGIGASGSISKRTIASATTCASSSPEAASSRSAARAT